MDPEQRLLALGLELPILPPSAANRVRALTINDLVFLSGHVAQDTPKRCGKVGRDITLSEGKEIAQATALALLSSLRDEIGSLSRVRRVVKVFGMVNAAPGFTDTHMVVDGCSDLLIAVFGPASGRHARSAVGVAELPGDAPVEIEMIVQI